jgi:hypothetical protein
MRGSRNVTRRTFAFMRQHPNQKFTAAEVAERIGAGAKLVSAVLCGGYAMLRVGLQREAVEGQRSFLYWMSDAGEFAGSDPSAYAVARWMLRHGKPVVPSFVAKATGIPIETVAALLEHWSAKGSAVRCELVLREGFDRFEYRMAASSTPYYSSIRPGVALHRELDSILEAA